MATSTSTSKSNFLDELEQFRRALPGDFITGDVAAEFVARMEMTNPDVFWDWMVDNAVRFCADAINFQIRRERQIVMRRAKSRAFAFAVQSGDPTELRAFSLLYSVGPDHRRRTVGEMTGADHTWVADSYSASGKKSLMLAAFHKAVARRVGDKKTSDVMSETEYEKMLGSVLVQRDVA